MTKSLTIVGLAGIALATIAAGDPDLGHSVRNNAAVQIVDMHPHYAGVPMEGGSGVRSTEAVRRYLKGEIKALAKVQQSATVGQQGGAE